MAPGLCLFLLFAAIYGRIIRQPDNKEPIELDELLNSEFSNKLWNGTWISDDTFLYKNSEDDIVKYNVKEGTSTVFLAASVLAQYSGSSVTFSDDKSLALIRYNVSSVFRHSTTAQYTIYDIVNDKYYNINNGLALQLATFAPVEHGLAYVFENNIYYIANVNQIESPTQITTMGQPGVIYCGAPDWVYEEEVFGTGSALWFSPDGKHLAFAVFNDTEVKEFSYFIYGEPGSLTDQYPTEAKIRYPKVGTNNPEVTAFVAALEPSTALTKLTYSAGLSDAVDHLILYDITWITNDEIAMVAMNRVQNEGTLTRCNVDGSCVLESTYKSEKGWLDSHTPNYNKDGTKRLEILPQPEGDDLFDHLVLTDVETNKAIRLTTGKKVVTTVYGWDETKKIIYYGATGEDLPDQQYVYAVSEDGLDQCLSCDLKATLADTCTYATASFSKQLSYVAKQCRGLGPAYVEIQELGNVTNSLVWENNSILLAKLANKKMPVIKDMRVPINDKFDARVRLLLPPDLDESASKKYPAIVYVYAGPDSNSLTDNFAMGYQNYFVTNREYIYIYIDGRGSGRDGKNKLFQVYRNLGTVEIEDQITVTKYLQDNLPYIDETNTGIWGWSYGGFSTAWVLVKDKENVFKFGLSVAPVTSFIYYDSIYTERYMGLPTPEDNELGYNNTDITRNVEALRGKLFFLIHGNADDNVHYQQSMALAKALEIADIQFRQQSYPDENHSLGHVHPHLYHTIDKFFEDSIGFSNSTKSKKPKKY